MYSVQCTVYSVQCTVYSVQCTVCSVQCTVYSVQCTVYSVQCTVHSAQCSVYSVQCTVYSVQCAVCSVQCTVYSVQCAVCSVQCTVYSVQCTVHSVQRTAYSAQCTVYSVQCTVYSVQCTVYSVQCTVCIAGPFSTLYKQQRAFISAGNRTCPSSQVKKLISSHHNDYMTNMSAGFKCRDGTNRPLPAPGPVYLRAHSSPALLKQGYFTNNHYDDVTGLQNYTGTADGIAQTRYHYQLRQNARFTAHLQ